MKKLLVSVYKSSHTSEMYLYVLKQEQFSKVPDTLKQVFGQEKHVMDLLLTPEKKLARVETEAVIKALEETGFYLQMPPSDSYDTNIFLAT